MQIIKKLYSFVFITFLNFIILLSLNTKTSKSVVVSKLSNEKELLQQLKEYKIHNKICDKYLNRYSVIRDIEYYDFNGNVLKNGTIIVLDVLVEDVIEIFNELKKIKFPIEPIDPKMGRFKTTTLFLTKIQDNEEFANSFTGGYSCRFVLNTKTLSMHSYGVAIDLNFLHNPCVVINEEKQKITTILPKAGIMYLNRKKTRPKKVYGYGKIDDKIVQLFFKHGFDVWGGNWDSPIDFQHFQVSDRKFAELLINTDYNNSKKIFNIHKKCVNFKHKSLSDVADDYDIDLLNLYYTDNTLQKEYFFKKITKICKK